jgi:lipoprotein-anchoring transpeptidase ErfK/SrfK
MIYQSRWQRLGARLLGVSSLALLLSTTPLPSRLGGTDPAQAAPAKPSATKLSTTKLSTTQQKIRDLKRSKQRWIQVNLAKQRVIAWDGDRWVDAMIVSTGKDSTPTPTGVYEIYVKHRETRMRGDDYDISDVPHVMYFTGGYGFHGAYWHNSFGTPVSHGCVNLAPDKAKWLYNFATVGTPVVIQR